MPAYPCPKGHDSADPDFCSVCGAKVHPAPISELACPDCGAARDPAGGPFCEICGFNFATGAHGELKPAPAAAPIPLEPAVPDEWAVTVSVDPSLRKSESPEAPAGFAPLTFPLAKGETLIGRNSERRAIHPDIALDQDDAVSHRHALLTRSPEGALTLRDVGSVNGIVLNGQPVPALTDMPLHDNDVFTLGHWSRVLVKTAPPKGGS